jgi:dipeptidyl aminopeptidase/acylaminoacyl peptidase
MTEPRTAPFGSWISPVTTDLMTAKTVGLGSLAADGKNVYWLEARPNEAGRSALLRWSEAGGIEELTPPPVNIGSRAHEYGGGAFGVADGWIVYSEKTDGALWLIEPGAAAARPLVTVAGCRYADFTFDLARRRLIAIREDHRDRPPTDPKAAIVAISLDPAADPATNGGIVLVDGPDFLSHPRLSPDGGTLAWVAWDHPNMPWDSTRLYCAALDGAGVPTQTRLVAGTDAESIIQPLFAPDGTLHFSSDRTGWWNLYAVRGERIEAVCPVTAEIGGPGWVFGIRFFDFAEDGAIICSIVENGLRRAARIEAGKLTRLDLGAVQECPVPFGRDLVWVSTEPQAPPAIKRLAAGVAETLRVAGPAILSPADVSVGQPITFPSADGATAHAFFYAPKNSGFAAPAGEKPPLIVAIHGGPTSMTTNGFALGIQWWTTRGFAVVDVNYGGSTGFGRPYRQRLYGTWGLVDVADCIAAVTALSERGLVDPERVAIRGGSAGGYTTLAGLAASPVFKAGASHFGVADLKLLAEDTHKFESRYLDNLLGPLPEAEAVYRARSPIHNVGAIQAPAIFFQGLEDKVVPPNQAETMVEAMADRQLPVAYYAFEGEGHGFRRADTIRRTLELELGFYGKIFGFDPPGLSEAVVLRNLP